jgi:hypothetical protein
MSVSMSDRTASSCSSVAEARTKPLTTAMAVSIGTSRETRSDTTVSAAAI